MASAVATEFIGSRDKIQLYNHDPDGASANVTTVDAGTTNIWWDMRDFRSFGVMAMTTVLGGSGITKLEIVADTASDGTGTTVVIKDSGTIAADAEQDVAFQECSAEEIAFVGRAESTPVDLRYVAARITTQNSGDEAAVLYMMTRARFPATALTPATTIA